MPIVLSLTKRLKLTWHQLAMAVGFDIPLYGNVWDAIFKYGNNLWYIDVSMYDRETCNDILPRTTKNITIISNKNIKQTQWINTPKMDFV